MASDHLAPRASKPRFSTLLIAIAMVAAAGMLITSYVTRMTPHDALKNGDPVDRVQAVEELIKQGRDGVPVLAHALKNYNRETRISAMFGLGRIGSAADAAVDAVRDALVDPNDAVRSVAVGTIWQIRQKHPYETASLILPMSDDPSDDVRRSVENTLEEIGERAPELLVRLILDESNSIQKPLWAVLRKISQQGTVPEIANAVNRMLAHPNRVIHDEALFSLVIWDQASADEVRELLSLGEKPFQATSINQPATAALDACLRSMTKFGSDSKKFLPEVVDLLERQAPLEVVIDAGDSASKDDQSVHTIHPRFESLLKVLSRIQSDARDTVPLLIRRLNEVHPPTQVLVAGALVDVGCDPQIVVPVLAKLLTSHVNDSVESSSFRMGRWNEKGRLAATILSRVSPEESRRIAECCIDKLSSESSEINRVALNVLSGCRSLGADEVMQVMIPLISHRDSDVRKIAIDTLSSMGPAAAPAVKPLLDQLEGNAGRRDPESSRRIILALGEIGSPSREAVPILLKVLEDPDSFMELEITEIRLGDLSARTRTQQWNELFRLSAISSLGKIGDSRPEVLSSLRGQSRSPVAERRIAAVKALRIEGAISEQTLSELVSLLDDSSLAVQVQTAITLANLSGDRTSAVKPLEQLLGDKYPYVRQAAIIALGKIGPDARSAVPLLKEIPPERVHLDSSWYARLTGRAGSPSWFDETPDFPRQTMQQSVQFAVTAISGEPN